jgi:hypothetical protein
MILCKGTLPIRLMMDGDKKVKLHKWLNVEKLTPKAKEMDGLKIDKKSDTEIIFKEVSDTDFFMHTGLPIPKDGSTGMTMLLHYNLIGWNVDSLAELHKIVKGEV